jgi:carbon-monoxide dehydrogenase medium subunit
MRNSRIITNEFEFFQPKQLTELFELQSDTSIETQLMAGGTDVLPQLKEGRKSPKRIISTMKIQELDFVEIHDDTMKIGATSTLKKVATACKGVEGFNALYEGISSIGKLQILNMGTIAGNICTASPAADSTPALLTMDSTLTLKSKFTERQIALKEFLLGPGKVALEPGELLYCIEVKLPKTGAGSRFVKIERVGADIAKINIAVVVKRAGDICESCRVAVGSCGPTTLLINGPDELLRGKKITDLESDLLIKAGNMVSAEVKPISDVRSTAEYRRKIASVIFLDAFKEAWIRARGEI